MVQTEAEQLAAENQYFAKSNWRKFGEYVCDFRWAILLVLLALAIPVGVTSLPRHHPLLPLCLIPSVPRFKHAAGLVPLMPRSGDATRTILELQNVFGVGALFPTTLLVVPHHAFTHNASDAKNLTQWRVAACKALKAIAQDVQPDKAPAFTSQATPPVAQVASPHMITLILWGRRSSAI